MYHLSLSHSVLFLLSRYTKENGFLRISDNAQSIVGSKFDGGTGGTSGFETCMEQSKCLSFSVTKLESGCGKNCPVEICLILDLTKSQCAKSDTVSHVCDTAGIDGCPYSPDAVDGDTATGSCGLALYESNGYHSISKCENVPSGLKMCQVGGKNEWLEFIL
jgi:hypothetical protein